MNDVKIRVRTFGNVLKIERVSDEHNKVICSTDSLLVLDNVVARENKKVTLHPLIIEILENRYFINSKDVIASLESGDELIDVVPTDKYSAFLEKHPAWKSYRSYLSNARNWVHTELIQPYSADVKVVGYDGVNIAYGKTEDELNGNIQKMQEEFINSELKSSVSNRCTSSLVEFLSDEIDPTIWIVNHLVPSGVYVLFDPKELDIYAYSASYKTEKIANNVLEREQLQNSYEARRVY
jgi:hypothetical protein